MEYLNKDKQLKRALRENEDLRAASEKTAADVAYISMVTGIEIGDDSEGGEQENE